MNSIKYFYLSLFLVPLIYTNRIIDINILHALLLSVIILFIAILYYKEKSFEVQIPIMAVYLPVLFSGILILSGLINGYSFQIQPYISLIATITVMVFIFSFNQDTGNRLQESLINCASVVTLIFSVIGLLQIVKLDIFDFRETLRLGSTLNLRNSAAEFLSLAIPLIFFKLLTTANKWKYVYTLSFFICLSYLITLRTRSAMLVCFILCLLILSVSITTFRTELKVRFSFSYVVLCLIGIIFIVYTSALYTDSERENLGDSIIKTFDLSDGPGIGRIHYFKSVSEILIDHPVIGTGPGSFYSNFRKYNLYMSNDDYLRNNNDINPHSVFLHIANDSGITGLTLIALAIFVFVIKIRRDVKFTFFNFVLISVFAGSIIIMSVSFAYINLAFMILFSFIAGRLISQFRVKKVLPKVYSTLILIILALFSIIINSGRFYSEQNYLKALTTRDSNLSSIYFNRIFESVYPVDPNQIPPGHYQTSRLIAKGDLQSALNIAIRARKIQPYYAPIWNNIGTINFMLGEKQVAIVEFDKIMNTFRNYIEPQINLMLLYYNSGEILKAKEVFFKISNKNELVSEASNYDNYLKLKSIFDD